MRRLIGGKSLVRAGLGKEELGLAVGLRLLWSLVRGGRRRSREEGLSVERKTKSGAGLPPDFIGDREESEGGVYLPNTCYICIGRSLEEHHAPR